MHIKGVPEVVVIFNLPIKRRYVGGGQMFLVGIQCRDMEVMRGRRRIEQSNMFDSSAPLLTSSHDRSEIRRRGQEAFITTKY